MHRLRRCTPAVGGAGGCYALAWQGLTLKDRLCCADMSIFIFREFNAGQGVRFYEQKYERGVPSLT